MSKHPTAKPTKATAKATAAAKAAHQEIYQTVGAAKVKLRAGDIAGAMVDLDIADKAAQGAVSDYRAQVATGAGSRPQRKHTAKVANGLIDLRKRVGLVKHTVANGGTVQPAPLTPNLAQAPGLAPPPRKSATPTPPRKTAPRKRGAPRKVQPTPARPVSMEPSMSLYPPNVSSAARGISNPGGYSRAGGFIQSPPGAGMYMRVPFQAVGAFPAVNTPFGFLAPLGAPNFLMNTPQLPWLTYRLRGLVIERMSNVAGAADSITVEDLREQGGPNLVIGEGRMGVESFRMGDRHLVGLRYNPIVQAPNFLEVRIRGNGPGQTGNTAGSTVVYVSAIIETIEDTTYGKINNLTTRLNQGHFGGGQGKGYVFPSGAPISGTVQRIPLRVLTEQGAAPAVNALNASSYRLNNAIAAGGGIVLQSEQISWAEMQIVGVEFATPVKTNVLDTILFEDLQVGGGASLFAQAGEVPAINFLGDESGRGGGSHSMCGLRHYPLLSATNVATLTVSGRVGSTGALGLGGTIDVPYTNLLVDRLVDDVFGIQPAGARSPYGAASNLLP